MEYDDVEYKKIYDIETLKKYHNIAKKLNLNEYDDTLSDNINIYELENIVSNNIDMYYNNTLIYHIVPIFFSLFTTIGTISICSYFM